MTNSNFFFFFLKIELICKELRVHNYMQFYYVIPDHDFHNELRYLSNDNHIILLFKCPVPLNPKVDVYVEHKALIPLSMEKQLLIRDVSFEPRVSDGDNDDDDVGE